MIFTVCVITDRYNEYMCQNCSITFWIYVHKLKKFRSPCRGQTPAEKEKIKTKKQNKITIMMFLPLKIKSPVRVLKLLAK